MISAKMVSRICSQIHCIMHCPTCKPLRSIHYIVFLLSFTLTLHRRNSMLEVAAGAGFILCPTLEYIDSACFSLSNFTLHASSIQSVCFLPFRGLSTTFADISISMETVFLTYTVANFKLSFHICLNFRSPFLCLFSLLLLYLPTFLFPQIYMPLCFLLFVASK